jgi:hypothetical protein
MMIVQRAACLFRNEDLDMPKGEQKKKTDNKPKLTVKEKKAKKKEKTSK